MARAGGAIGWHAHRHTADDARRAGQRHQTATWRARWYPCGRCAATFRGAHRSAPWHDADSEGAGTLASGRRRDRWRSTRVGIGRVRARQRDGGEQEGPHPGRTGFVRGSWHESLRAVAQDDRPRGSLDLDSCGRPVLEADLMPLTAGEVVARIKSRLGVPWRDTTYRDTFKFGGSDTEVKGIATTMFCTLEVVQEAAKA